MDTAPKINTLPNSTEEIEIEEVETEEENLKPKWLINQERRKNEYAHMILNLTDLEKAKETIELILKIDQLENYVNYPDRQEDSNENTVSREVILEELGKLNKFREQAGLKKLSLMDESDPEYDSYYGKTTRVID